MEELVKVIGYMALGAIVLVLGGIVFDWFFGFKN